MNMLLAHRWYNSAVFDKDWFGSAFGSPENGYAISESRFGNVSTIYDPDGALVDSRISPYHNAYGYVTSSYNYQVVGWWWISLGTLLPTGSGEG